MSQKLIVITGPTAAGKTGLGIRLAQILSGEVVSADSMQIYRGMDVGTAKPTLGERMGVPHHMIDVADPHESYSVARYVAEASACVDDILAQGKTPIVVGGTGLYIESLLLGRGFAEQGVQHPQGADVQDAQETGGLTPPLRVELLERYDRLGGEVLWRELREIDPLAAERLHPNDKKRIVRAIEVFRLTGQTITAHNEATRALPVRYEAVKLAITATDRADLYRRIDSRVDAMLEQGLVGEVTRLLESGLSPGSTAMQAIGYKEMAEVILGEVSLETAVERVKQESRRYAKRQLSWIRRDSDCHWIFWDGEPDPEKTLHVSTEFCRRAGIMI